MKTRRSMAIIFFLFLSVSNLQADGNYYIGEDEGGVYFQTDNDGGWYIDAEDLRYFTIGDSGHYSIKRDKKGKYIITEKKRKFYLDFDAKEQMEKEITRFNQEQQKSEVRATQVIIRGNQVLVPVLLGSGGKETKALLLLDTGASTIALHRNIADQLNIKNTRKVEIMVVGGSTIRADVAELDYVKVGPKIKKNLYTSIIEHTGPKIAYQGLLGMNFLIGLDYTIDDKRQLIHWK